MNHLYLFFAAAAPTETMAMIMSLLPMILIFVLFYFLLIRPQKKREKEIQKMREAIEVGDEIITAGGIIGRLVSIKDDTIVIETAGDRSKIRLARWAIQANNTANERLAEEKAKALEEKKAAKGK